MMHCLGNTIRWWLCMLVCLSGITSAGILDSAAQYKRVTILSGSQLFKSNEVTVSFAGQPPSFTGSYLCGYGPYHIGYFVEAFFFRFNTPVSYTFAFNKAVRQLRVDVGDLTNVDVVSIDINNVPYLLTNSNLSAPPHQAICTRDTAIIAGGSITAPPGYPPAGSVFTAGKLTIKESAGITNATVAFTGFIMPSGYSGTYFSLYFGAVDAGNSGPVCAGDSLKLYGDTTITEPGIFRWTGPNGFTADVQNPVRYPLTPADTGIYTLTFVTGVDTFSDATHVTLLPGPNIPYITGDNYLCTGQELVLQARATAGALYTWTGPNGFAGSGPVLRIAGVQPADAGRYVVEASLLGCAPRAGTEVVVLPGAQRKFTKVACGSEGYFFNGRMLYEPGVYSDTFTAANGCDSLSILTLTVLPAPDISIRRGSEAVACLGDTVLLWAEGNAVGYRWYDPGGTSLGSARELRLPLAHYTTTVELLGISDNNCGDTATVTLIAEGCCGLFIPNAFSPNGDGVNDLFYPETKGHIQQYHLSIYNRWGQRVFTSSNLTHGWNGITGGQPAETGTYHYLLHADCIEGQSIKEKGDLLLIR